MINPKNEIRIEKLVKSFGANKALDDISLEFTGTGPFGIVGPDGAGKTTLMRIIAGVMSFKGNVAVLGSQYPRESNHAKRHIGYMPQIFGLYQDLSVRENLIFFAEIFGMAKSQIAQRMPELLEFASLDMFEDRPAGKLSGGMKQKLALCACLIHDPKLLILDEPGAGVDPISRQEFWDILNSLVEKGIIVIVATTYMDEAERCKRVTYLRDGRICADGSVQKIRADYPLKLIKFQSEKLRELRDFLTGSGRFIHVNFFADSVHAAGESDLDSLERFIHQELQPQFNDISWDEIQPELEDVFVHLGQEADNNVL
ncbi:ABC transporter ATP-binding protein [bacterium]|nr:ABC transporter ATP-binding protein [bacterium]